MTDGTTSMTSHGSGGLVIALDGPAASGKSSVGARAAEALGYRFVDTGLLYRGVTWLALRHATPLTSGEEVAALVPRVSLVANAKGRLESVLVDGRDVTSKVLGPDVDRAVSEVARQPEVRQALLARQRALVADGGIVVAGRDIGTVVLPDADVKIFLEASAEERAKRRAAQRGLARDSTEAAAILADLRRRDAIDRGRATAPLKAADDAVHVVTDGYSLRETVQAVVDVVRRVIGASEPEQVQPAPVVQAVVATAPAVGSAEVEVEVEVAAPVPAIAAPVLEPEVAAEPAAAAAEMAAIPPKRAVLPPRRTATRTPALAAERVTPAAEAVAPETEPAALAPEPDPGDLVTPEPEPVPVEPEPEIIALAPAPEPVVAEPVPEAEPVVAPVPEPVALEWEPEPEPVAFAPEPEPEALPPEPEPEPEAEYLVAPVPEPVAVEWEPELVALEPEPEAEPAPAAIELSAPEPEPEPVAATTEPAPAPRSRRSSSTSGEPPLGDDVTPFITLTDWVGRTITSAITRVHIEGLDEPLDIDGPLIVAANHASNADGVLVASWLTRALGRRIYLIGKQEALDVPVMGWALRQNAVIGIQRGAADLEAYRAARRVLDEGHVLGLFPEGTRSPDGRLQEAKEGAAILALRTGAPILPIGISGTHRFWPRGQKLFRPGGHVRMRVGEPFRLDPVAAADRRRGQREATRRIMTKIAELLPRSQRGVYTDDVDRGRTG